MPPWPGFSSRTSLSGGCRRRVLRQLQPGLVRREPLRGDPGPDHYSWALIYTYQPSQDTGQALVAMLDWLTHNGQAYAAADGYVPLPSKVQQLARIMLQQITGPGGAHLLS